jgi:hypothetical protein
MSSSTNYLGIHYLFLLVPSVCAESVHTTKCAFFAVKINLGVICSVVNSLMSEFHEEQIIDFTLN